MLEWLFGKKKQQPQKPKQKKSKKQQEAEDKWMYDFMMQFLSSPIWTVSILDFVDNKCIVFDNEEENKFEYTIIHNEFKQLVGNLVDGMMEEIGMSQEKLAEIIEKGFQSKQKALFNQLLLADDFLKFKKLMVSRNKALQQQALKAIQQSQIKTSSHKQKPSSHSEEQLMRESKKIQDQRQHKLQEEEEEMIRKAIELSRIQSKESQAMRELEQKATDKVTKQQVPQQNSSVEQNHSKLQTKKAASRLEPLKSSQQSAKTFQLSDLPPLKGSLHKSNKAENDFQEPIRQKVEQPKEQSKPQLQQVKSEQTNETTEEKGPSESMQDRKQRLIAQRQKIRKQKEEQRRKQLEQEALDTKEKQSHQVVHTVVLQQDGFYDPPAKKQVSQGQQTSVSEEELKRRKELMNKIKNRIIDDF